MLAHPRWLHLGLSLSQALRFHRLCNNSFHDQALRYLSSSLPQALRLHEQLCSSLQLCSSAAQRFFELYASSDEAIYSGGRWIHNVTRNGGEALQRFRDRYFSGRIPMGGDGRRSEFWGYLEPFIYNIYTSPVVYDASYPFCGWDDSWSKKSTSLSNCY